MKKYKLILPIFLIILIIISMYLINVTEARYVLSKGIQISCTTSDYYFDVEVTPTEVSSFPATLTVTAKNNNGTNYTNADLKYTIGVDNTNYTVVGGNTVRTLEGGSSTELTEQITINKTGTTDNSSLINLVFTVTEPYTDSKSVEINISSGMKATDVANNATIFYGAEVKGYSCPIDTQYESNNETKIKWRIFHSDGKNIYLIPDYYIANKYLPNPSSDAVTTGILNRNDTYKAHFENIISCYAYGSNNSGSAWIRNNNQAKEIANDWLTWVNDTPYQNSANDNIKAVAYMLDTKAWSSFTNTTYADYCIGGPTIEMYCASYEKTHSKHIDWDKSSDRGYAVRWSDSDSQYSSYLEGLSTDFNRIYRISGASTDSSYGYWIASPAPRSTDNSYVLCVDCWGRIDVRLLNYDSMSFRPIVRLKSEVELKSNGDGTYQVTVPIIAQASYDTTTDKVKIQVTHSEYGIAQIKDENNNVLGNSTVETTVPKLKKDGTYTYTITDNRNNTKTVTIPVADVYRYQIPDLATLKTFRDAVNAGNTYSGKTVELVADIDMNQGKYSINNTTGEITFASDAENWTPIGNTVYFSGTFNGKNYTINGLYINCDNDYQALFGFNNGTIKNLKVNGMVQSNETRSAGICALNVNGLIENCTNYAQVKCLSTTQGSWKAGVVALMLGGKALNCTNYGKISNEYTGAGGIVGYTRDSFTEVIGCMNYGKIYSKANSAGGIVGGTYSKTNISNCYNEGAVSVDASNAGGILGQTSPNNTGITIIEKCHNNGKISCENYYSGGIIGISGGNLEIVDCKNTGEINSKRGATGGIVGGISGNDAKIINATLKKCFNSGNICSEEAPGQTGGIVGIVQFGDLAVINNCYNTGIIEAKNSSGINRSRRNYRCY